MSSITEIGQIYIYLFALVFVFWSLKTVAQMISIFHKKQKITHTQAKISLLRMSIKRSLRQKSNQVLQSKGLDSKMIQEIKTNYKELSEIDLNDPKMYPELMVGLKKIYDLFSQTQLGLNHQIDQIQMDKETPQPAIDLDHDFSNLFFWQTLFQTDQSVFISIFEIVTLTSQLKTMMEQFNLAVRESERYKQIPAPIEIDYFHLLKHVVLENQILDGTEKVA